MFVRRNANGDLVVVGSVHTDELAQLQTKAEKKAAPKKAAAAKPVEPAPEPEPEPAPTLETTFKSALDVKGDKK